MAKHRIDRTRQQALRYLLLAALVLGLGVRIGWGKGQSANAPTPPAKAGQGNPRSARTKAAAPGTTQSSSASSLGEGRRDPFKLPETGTSKSAGSEGGMETLPQGGVLPPGKRGLIISQLKLEGVVRQQISNKMTALVVDQRKLAYFLHENDSVYNGVVSKITPDSIYFKENVLDDKGHVTTREVVKRLGAASGEGR